MNLERNNEMKLKHFKNLVVIALADGYLHDNEKEFLQERAEDFGLDSEIVKEILENADTLQFMSPLLLEEKEDLLSDAVFIMMIDGSIHEKEYNLCLKIAEKLDFNKSQVDKIIEMVNKLC